MTTSPNQKNAEILITKVSGDQELFSIEKFKQSLRNAGTKEEAIDFITDHIGQLVYPGISTRKIYAKAFALLRKHHKPSAIKYRLKRAILEIGPTGYPFESLMGQLFEAQGYETQVGVVLEGRCVTHEMDVVASNRHEQHLVECKYHKDQGKNVSVQVPLYVRSRVNDIIEKRQMIDNYRDMEFNGWVVTNTRFSSDSLAYGTCAGLRLLAWDYPRNNALKDLIERFRLYPVSILQKLNRNEKKALLEQGIISCKDLMNNKVIIEDFKLTNAKYKALLEELNFLLT